MLVQGTAPSTAEAVKMKRHGPCPPGFSSPLTEIALSATFQKRKMKVRTKQREGDTTRAGEHPGHSAITTGLPKSVRQRSPNFSLVFF